MKHLILAHDNNLNYIIVRDMDRANEDTAIVNWDLSDDEVEEIKKKFEQNENDESFYESEPEWEEFEAVMSRMNDFRHIG